ncbi:MAG TPA: hypothetical protein VK141_08970 [Nitrosomonas sp.]|nr:hypothetical protein [Nitrosomonas sp.]
MPSITTRPAISDAEKDEAIEQTLQELDYQLMKKGQGSFMSSHEIYGVIKEELDEVMDEVRKSDGLNKLDHEMRKVALKKELAQLAVAAIWGIASIDHCEWI